MSCIFNRTKINYGLTIKAALLMRLYRVSSNELLKKWVLETYRPFR